MSPVSASHGGGPPVPRGGRRMPRPWGELPWGFIYTDEMNSGGLSSRRRRSCCKEEGTYCCRLQARMATSTMVSTAAVARATPAQSSMVAPFTGLRSSAAFPAARRPNADLSTLPSNGGRVQCMQVWPTEGLKKFETLSYLRKLEDSELLKQVEYLLRNKWIPCLEFCKEGFVTRKFHASPGYYDGRYWTMWKLPMFGCTDASQVIQELREAAKAYPEYFVRIIGFDNRRQVQCISFIAYKPPGY